MTKPVCLSPVVNNTTNLLFEGTVILPKGACLLRLVAGPLFEVILEHRLLAYGPCRAPKGFARECEIPLDSKKAGKALIIRILSYGFPAGEVDSFEPYCEAEIYDKDHHLLMDTSNFSFSLVPDYLRRSSRYSYRRGFVERYDERKTERVPLPMKAIDAPVILGSFNSTRIEIAEPISSTGPLPFAGFESDAGPGLCGDPLFKDVNHFDVTKEFLDVVKTGYSYEEWDYGVDEAGIFSLDFDTEEEQDVFLVFEEAKIKGEWQFRRSGAQDLITIHLKAGKTHFLSAAPYCFRFVRLLFSQPLSVHLSIYRVANQDILPYREDSDPVVSNIQKAARRSFAENAYDILTDCPGRERTGWLCDSFFTGRSESHFTGKADREHDFLENFIVGTAEEIAPGMIPMCFPSEEITQMYIPNWAMWFVLEMEDYAKRTGDRSLIEKSQEKIKNLLDFLSRFENEWGLLEDLGSSIWDIFQHRAKDPHAWLFIEWSNAASYVNGVSFPTNMLYAATLEAYGRMYHDVACLTKAMKIRQKIQEVSFFDRFYHDHALRDGNGSLKTVPDRISEACQYYALFFGFDGDAGYFERVKDELGPFGKHQEKIDPCAPFIGFLLRLEVLHEHGAIEELRREAKAKYGPMAEITGTLWETFEITNSLNHAVSSYVGVLLETPASTKATEKAPSSGRGLSTH